MTKKKKYEIHASDMAQFKSCRVRWNFASPLRRNLEVAFPPTFFFLGSGIHAALASYYEKGIDPVRAFKLWYWWKLEQFKLGGAVLPKKRQLEYAEQAKLGIGMLRHYKETYPLEQEEFKLIVAESVFDVPIRTLSGRRSAHYYAAGIFDGVVIDKHGRYWLLEHKSYKMDRGEVQYELTDQAKMYVYAAREKFSLPVQGVVYNILRKKLPTIPRELQRGGLSKSKNIDTTAAIYLREIRKQGLEPSDYAEILARLEEKGNTFFNRYLIRKTPQEMAIFQRLLYVTAREMCKPKVILYPCNDDWICRNCWFREPCYLVQLGEKSVAEDWINLNTRPRTHRADDRFDYDHIMKVYKAIKESKQQATPSESRAPKIIDDHRVVLKLGGGNV